MSAPQLPLIFIGALSVLLLVCRCGAQEAPPTLIPRSNSPDGSYSLQLGYNVVGVEGPTVEVVDLRSRVLGRVLYPIDAEQKFPEILWNPNSTAVALNSKQVHYTSLSILLLSADRRRFLELEVPDLVALSGGRIKSVDELLPRVSVAARKWLDGQTLLVHASMMLSDKSGTALSFRVKLRISEGRLLISEVKAVPE